MKHALRQGEEDLRGKDLATRERIEELLATVRRESSGYQPPTSNLLDSHNSGQVTWRGVLSFVRSSSPRSASAALCRSAVVQMFAFFVAFSPRSGTRACFVQCGSRHGLAGILFWWSATRNAGALKLSSSKHRCVSWRHELGMSAVVSIAPPNQEPSPTQPSSSFLLFSPRPIFSFTIESRGWRLPPRDKPRRVLFARSRVSKQRGKQQRHQWLP